MESFHFPGYRKNIFEPHVLSEIILKDEEVTQNVIKIFKRNSKFITQVFIQLRNSKQEPYCM